jgi:hypothetical protein
LLPFFAIWILFHPSVRFRRPSAFLSPFGSFSLPSGFSFVLRNAFAFNLSDTFYQPGPFAFCLPSFDFSVPFNFFGWVIRIPFSGFVSICLRILRFCFVALRLPVRPSFAFVALWLLTRPSETFYLAYTLRLSDTFTFGYLSTIGLCLLFRISFIVGLQLGFGCIFRISFHVFGVDAMRLPSTSLASFVAFEFCNFLRLFQFRFATFARLRPCQFHGILIRFLRLHWIQFDSSFFSFFGFASFALKLFVFVRAPSIPSAPFRSHSAPPPSFRWPSILRSRFDRLQRLRIGFVHIGFFGVSVAFDLLGVFRLPSAWPILFRSSSALFDSLRPHRIPFVRIRPLRFCLVHLWFLASFRFAISFDLSDSVSLRCLPQAFPLTDLTTATSTDVIFSGRLELRPSSGGVSHRQNQKQHKPKQNKNKTTTRNPRTQPQLQPRAQLRAPP